MALNCEETLSVSIAKNCDTKPMGGIEVNVVAIPFSIINKTTSTIDVTNDLLITSLNTNSGTAGYMIEGIKQAQGASFELVKKEDSFDAYKHSFSGVILSPSAANKKALSQLASGSKYVIVVEKKWKGTSQADAFEVLGWDAGLVISEVVWNTKESNGIIKFTLSSEDGFEEPDMSRNVLETTYALTKTAFDAMFATV